MAQSLQTHLGQLGPIANVVIKDQNGQPQIVTVIQATNTKQTGAGTMQLTLPGGKQVAATLATKTSTGGTSQDTSTAGVTRAILKAATPAKLDPGTSQGNIMKTTAQVVSIKYPNNSTVQKGQVITIPVNAQSNSPLTIGKNSHLKLATSNGGQLQLVSTLNNQIKTIKTSAPSSTTNHIKVPAVASSSVDSPKTENDAPDTSTKRTPIVVKTPIAAKEMKTPIKIPDSIQCYVVNVPKSSAPSGSTSSTNSVSSYKPLKIAPPTTPSRPQYPTLPGYVKTYSPSTPGSVASSPRPTRIAARPTPPPPPKTPFISSILDRSGSRKRQDFEINYSFEGKRRRSEKGSKGLRHFSNKVCEKVERKGITTYNEVADELVTEFSDPMKITSIMEQQYDQKNIRRRVYDALNVLMAMGIIAKEKKEIRWLGLPVNSLHEAKELEKQRREIAERIKEKKANLNYLLSQQVALKNLLERNRRKEKEEGPPPPSSTVKLPFIVVNTSKNTVIDAEIEEDKSEYQFKFDNTFEIQDDIQVLFRMGLAMGLENGSCKPEDLDKILSVIPETFHPYVRNMCNPANRTQTTALSTASPVALFQSPRVMNQVVLDNSTVVKQELTPIQSYLFDEDTKESLVDDDLEVT